MNMQKRTLLDKPLFPLGRTVATPGALKTIEESGESPSFFLSRHHRGDWGDVCEEDGRENEFSLLNNGRLMSVYRTSKGKIWVISEGDRSSTTILLPEEY